MTWACNKGIPSGVPRQMSFQPKSDKGGGITTWLFHSNGESHVNHINTHHVVQADAPALKQNLTREAIDEGEPDLKETEQRHCLYAHKHNG